LDSTHRFVVLLLLIAVIWQPNRTYAQTSSNGIVNIPLTFHYYSLTQKATNNSVFIYDGVDGFGPKLSSGFQTILNSQIKGTYGSWTYWAASILWTLKLQEDMHVLGSVEMKVYVSSTFGFSFLSGGGYGMGLADVDENGNNVKEFTTQGPQSIGSNPFTQTPQAYILNTQVDYVFKKGHTIVFYMGAGASIQGFTFNVYFDYPDRNSGVKLPVEEQMKTYEFNTDWQNQTYKIVAISNSSLSDFRFDPPMKQISFNASGISGTGVYSQVYIPKTLLQGPFSIFIDSQQITPTETENTTQSSINFTYTHNSDTIKILGTTIVSEFPSFLVLPTFVMTTLLAAILLKQRKK
jgi:hypothetical protein